MPDPVPTEIAGGVSALATTTVSFPAQANGTLLLLWVASDDYRTTSGSGRPESTSWTLAEAEQGNLGWYLWWKITSGSDTSVQYTIGAAFQSTYSVTAVTNIDTGSPVDVTNSSINAAGNYNTGTTPSSGTTTAGRRIAFGGIGTPGNGAITGMSGWTNSYTEIHDRGTTSGYRDWMGVAYLVFDGGGTTSTGATFSTFMDQAAGITAVFKAAPDAPAGSSLPPRHPAIRLLPILAR